MLHLHMHANLYSMWRLVVPSGNERERKIERERERVREDPFG